MDAYSVEIEVNAGQPPSVGTYGVPGGDPQIVTVGLPDAAVKESPSTSSGSSYKDRVFTVIVNSGFKTHVGRTTIDLAPADIENEGPIFDLPIGR